MRAALLIILILVSATSQAYQAQRALVIIDMQDDFATRDGNQNSRKNPQILKSLIEKQKEMISYAKKMMMPIMVVEYDIKEYSHTNKELIDAIGNYSPVATVLKNTDGLFDPKNESVDKAKKILKNWGVSGLIVMGANGGYCVKETIRGALASGYKVAAYDEGIAELNYSDFISPYSYHYNYAFRGAGMQTVHAAVANGMR